jgi:3D (Asp-Asp-Asp) domain-containing protein
MTTLKSLMDGHGTRLGSMKYKKGVNLKNLLKELLAFVPVLMLTIVMLVGLGELDKKDAEIARLDSLLNEQDTTHMMITDHNEQLASALHLFTDGSPVIFTAYNSLHWQTDDDPFIMASGDSVGDGKLALSRDFLEVYGLGGDIAWGDTVWVVLPMEVGDSMNKRHSHRADIWMANLADALAFGQKKGYIYTN